MNASEALRRLRALQVPVITTADAAAALHLRTDATSQTLRRLREAGLVFSIRKGLWALDAPPASVALVEYVTWPYPGYVSLQSALYMRAMIEQIPSVLYVVSLGRAARIRTAVGAFSLHHLPPELFGGFEQDPGAGAKLATPEKALFDLAYLSGTRSRRFCALPELEIPRTFRPGRLRYWIRRIRSQRMRTLTTRRLEQLAAL
jgi:predicted transcriptional regulator of viral defense system